jgi:hypothetical protein
MSLNPSAGAVLRTFKIQRRGDDDDFDCECGLIDFRKWASDKEALLPWLCLDGFNPIDAALVPSKSVRFLACRERGCASSWEVPEAGWGHVISNLKKHVVTHLPSKMWKKEDDGLESESPESRGKSKPSQYEFSAQWLATGLPHYQVTRSSPSGMHSFLKERTNVPVSSPNTFDGNVQKFLECSSENMITALKGNWLFSLGDSSPDRLKREWISFGVSGIDRETNKWFYMPLGLNRAVGRLTAATYGEHYRKLLGAWEISSPVSYSQPQPTSICISAKSNPVVIGAGSDMGPGLRQVFEGFHGTCDVRIFARGG